MERATESKRKTVETGEMRKLGRERTREKESEKEKENKTDREWQ